MINPDQVATWRRRLDLDGFLYVPDFQPTPDGGDRALALARSLGPLFRLRDADPARPVLVTAARRDATEEEPFDQLAGIGWHNDFSTHAVRPRWSLSYVQREDPEGGGAWGIASVRALVAALDAPTRRDLRDPQPFRFSAVDDVRWYRPLTRAGLRFYGRALRTGARDLPLHEQEHVSRLAAVVEEAASRIGMTLPAQTGALLVVDNWATLHDRSPQSPGVRCAVLSWVLRAHPSSGQGRKIGTEWRSRLRP